MTNTIKPKLKKTKRFHIRFTEEDWKQIQKLSKKYKTNPSETIIALIHIGINNLIK